MIIFKEQMFRLKKNRLLLSSIQKNCSWDAESFKSSEKLCSIINPFFSGCSCLIIFRMHQLLLLHILFYWLHSNGQISRISLKITLSLRNCIQIKLFFVNVVSAIEEILLSSLASFLYPENLKKAFSASTGLHIWKQEEIFASKTIPD